MGEYEYAGAAPETGPDGEITRPGDRREFPAEPGWGAWRCLREPEPAAPPPPPVTTPAAPATPATGAEGM